MHAFHHGELLIGGMALRHLEGELDQEEPRDNSNAWLLSGKLRLSAAERERLQLDRQYLLKLDDGREGLVELTSLQTDGTFEGELLADFKPLAAKAR